MKLTKKLLVWALLFIISFLNLSSINCALATDSVVGTFDGALQHVMWDHSTDLTSDAVREWVWWKMFNEQVIALIWYAIDVFIAIWVAVALIWAYKIMVSDKEDSNKEWMKMVMFWVLWVIIMVSAKFLANALVWDDGVISGNIKDAEVIVSRGEPGIVWLDWINFASQLYDKIVYPFIKIALYLVVWFLFFVTVAKVITYVTSTDDSTKKKAWWVIIRTVVWILIIMWAKQVVESIMWKQDSVTNPNNAKILADIWSHFTDIGSIPLIAQIINRVMWLTMLVILILIIVQAYRIFAKPDDSENRKRLWKTIVYIIIWVLVIWAAYAISTALVVNKLWEVGLI